MSVKKIILGILNTSVRVAILIIVCTVIKNVCVTSYEYGYRVFSEQPLTTGDGIDKQVVIPIGSSGTDIGKILKNSGLIRDEKLFYIQELLSSYRGKLQPGTYTLNTSMTAEQMMAVLAGEGPEEEEAEENEAAVSTAGSSDVTADATSESGAVDLDVSGIDTEGEGTGEGEESEEGAGESEEGADTDAEQ